ncbi:MAG: hypothetical protein ACTSYI_04920 [Promethearchaeota archaeon]
MTQLTKRKSTRHDQKFTPIEDEDKDHYTASMEPLRLGRRESEPHSAEVSYLFDVLSINFPQHRAMWDLHHYFDLRGKEHDVQFDISFFLDLKISEELPSYRASEYGEKIPDLVVNVLSKSTWKNDLSKIQEICRNLHIPIYIVFMPYPISPSIFPIPFLRVYQLGNEGNYSMHDLAEFMYDDNRVINSAKKIELAAPYPFDIALQKLTQTYLGKKPRSRLILVKKGSEAMWLSRYDREKVRAEKAEKRAEKAEIRAEKAEERAEKAEERANKERQQVKDAERRIKELEQQIQK